MTLVHLLACETLAFAPFFILYKALELSDEGMYFVSLRSAFVHMLSTTVKMVALASCVSATEGVADPTLLDEALRAMVGLIDVVALSLYFPSVKIGSSSARILAVGIGWAFGESLLARAIPIFVGARASEFSWEYIMMAVESNIALFSSLAFSAAVWMMTVSRHRAGNSTMFNLAAMAMALHLGGRPLARGALELGLSFDSQWSMVVIQALVAAVACLMARAAYQSSRKAKQT